jgi:hypothetical protein
MGVSTEEVPLKRQKISKKSNDPNPLISRTEKCKVCDEPAAIHIHYGAITCFSCRAFFRRSIQVNKAFIFSLLKHLYFSFVL